MLFTCEDREQHVIPASHDLTNVIYRGVAGKEKGGQGRAPSPYQLLLDKLVKSNLLCYTRRATVHGGMLPLTGYLHTHHVCIQWFNFTDVTFR